MSTASTEPIHPNEATLRRQLGFIGEGILRSRRISNQREVKLRKWYTGISVVFSVLGAAGLLKTKAEALPFEQFSWAFLLGLISLTFLIAMELYRALGVEETAIRLLAAKEAYSLLAIETKHALQNDDPLAAIALVLEQSRSLEKMFHRVLPVVDDDEAKAEIQKWLENLLGQYRPEGGWQLPVSQQKPKSKRGES